MDLLLGIDFGTGGCKTTVIDTRGRIVDSRSAEYATSHPRPGWAEQQPADWYAALCGLLAEFAPEVRRRIRALALDSYTHGAVLLDARLRVIRPTIIWTDQRSTHEAEYLRAHHGELIFSTAFQMPSPTWTLPQLLWLRRHEPDAFAAIRHLSFVKDYVRYRLTGVLACDRIEAQGTLFWDMRSGCWSEALCALAGISPQVLPRIAEPTDPAGAITPAAAAATGLAAGTPVIMGASDTAVEDYAAGAIQPGQLVLKLATAGNVNVMTAEAHPHPETLTYAHVVPGLWYTATATNAAAVCQRWLRDLCFGLEAREARRRGVNPYDALDRLAEAVPPGANGVVFHPYLMGERSPYWDPHLRGSFTGLSMATTQGELSRALLEGVAYSLRDCYRTIEKLGLGANEAILIGGGAKSALWSRIVSNVFNLPVACPVAGDASFGSALLAGVGVGVFADEVTAVRHCLRIDRDWQPEADAVAVYARGFQRYRGIHDALADVYREEG